MKMTNTGSNAIRWGGAADEPTPPAGAGLDVPNPAREHARASEHPKMQQYLIIQCFGCEPPP
ncbi:MAG TPA: hypothetical protein VMA35_08185 [Candidatus Sulfopaludibacter sp.]|nr:hypothetical protein [Candidatus Sulfopaludibacter sp.]